MSHTRAGSSRDQKIVFALLDVLHDSLDLSHILEGAFPLLTQMVPADQGALCISNPAVIGGYDWATSGFAVDWFRGYSELMPHDFVRDAVVRQPNIVLRDSEMIARVDLEENMMYRRSLDDHMPLEQVMSVLLT